jgi:hypothetical protein
MTSSFQTVARVQQHAAEDVPAQVAQAVEHRQHQTPSRKEGKNVILSFTKSETASLHDGHSTYRIEAYNARVQQVRVRLGNLLGHTTSALKKLHRGVGQDE